MKADKVIVTIKMESLSIDTLRGMLSRVVDHVEGEVESGKLIMSDGDQIEWASARTHVEF
jgi:hypothetical protein